VLSGLEAVRKRPGMYLGSTGELGLHHFLWELVGNSIDQVLAKKAARVDVIIHEDASVEVVDDGPGIDLENPKIREWFTELHCGATADGHQPHVHIAPFGVGLAVVNALSTKFFISTVHDGIALQCQWTSGGDNGGTPIRSDYSLQQGTSVRAWPDPSIFDTTVFSVSLIEERLHEIGSLMPDIDLRLTVHHGAPTWQEGLVKLLASKRGLSTAGLVVPLTLQKDVVDSDGSTISVSIVLDKAPEDEETVIIGYCNYQLLSEEGEFLKQVRVSLGKVLEPFTIASRPIDVTALVSVTMLNPEFSGPTRGCIDDPRVVAAVEEVIESELPSLVDLAEWK